MRGSDFPIIGTKTPGVTKSFDLTSVAQRREYFDAKAGDEISRIRKYLKTNTFMVNMIGKKHSGKGTYSQLFAEAVGPDLVALISVGDIVRDIHTNWETFRKSPELEKLKKHYRAFVPFDQAMEGLAGSTTKKLAPTEAVLALLKYNFDKYPKKAFFLDGLPRETDQVSYSLYFRDLINYRDSQDVFALIDIPEAMIDVRLKTRSVCPKCQATRNIVTNPTKFVGYDKKTKEFYLMCDKPACDKARFVAKEGDSAGIDPIRPRLEKEGKVMDMVFAIHGVPKVFLRNSVPEKDAEKYFDAYEVAPQYKYEIDKSGNIVAKKTPWVFLDDEGNKSVAFFPPAIVVTFLKQMVEALNI